MLPPMRRLLLMLALGGATFLLAGCGGDSSESTSGRGTSPVEGQEGEAWESPAVGSTVEVPEGPPPKRLVIKDLAKGSGPIAKAGDEVEILYVDALYATGEVVSLAIPGAPFHLELGAREAIPGWEKGILGMRVGGRRELVIPARLSNEGKASLLKVALVGIE